MKFIASLLLLASCNVTAGTLLFTNNIPAETNTLQYYAGIQAISDAINAGYRIHCTLQLPENGGTAVFYSNVTDVKVSISSGVPYYVSAILDMRPHINNLAQALSPTPEISGSMDSYGQYWYNGLIQPGYVISWWAD